MPAELQLSRAAPVPLLDRPIRPLPVPWRDPHTVSPAELKEYIEFLEKACEENPLSADLRTCLGVAHAMNYDVYKSMDALEGAVGLDELSTTNGEVESWLEDPLLSAAVMMMVKDPALANV